MTSMTVFVAEDEELAREALVATLARVPGWSVIGAAGDGQAALEACLAEPPDVLLTDIRMPLLDGLELVAALREARPEIAVAFVTAHDVHAIEALRLAAVDYLLKPVAPAELIRCLTRIRDAILRRRGGHAGSDELATLLAQPSVRAERIVVRSAGRIDIVSVREVLAFRVERNYIDIITPNETWVHRETLKSLAARIDASRFVQVNRSVLVAVAHVRRVERDGQGGSVVLEGGLTFPVSRGYLSTLEEALGG